MQRITQLFTASTRSFGRCLTPILAASLVLALAGDVAAKGKGKGKGKKIEKPVSDAPPGFVGDTNAPGEYGESGYMSWGTNGGATLGYGNGVRASFIGGRRAALGTGNGGIEAFFIMGMSPDFDLLLGGRISFWWFGMSPGVRLRFRIIGNADETFHLAIDAGAYIGFGFTGGPLGIRVPGGVVNAFSGGTTIDPGIAGSVFVTDNMEIFFGAFIPISVTAGPIFAVSIGFNFRGGFVFTFKTINLGIFAQIDVIPTLVFHDRNAPTPQLGGAGSGTIGIQWRF